jgi:hypothetical protein
MKFKNLYTVFLIKEYSSEQVMIGSKEKVWMSFVFQPLLYQIQIHKIHDFTKFWDR